MHPLVSRAVVSLRTTDYRKVGTHVAQVLIRPPPRRFYHFLLLLVSSAALLTFTYFQLSPFPLIKPSPEPFHYLETDPIWDPSDTLLLWRLKRLDERLAGFFETYKQTIVNAKDSTYSSKKEAFEGTVYKSTLSERQWRRYEWLRSPARRKEWPRKEIGWKKHTHPQQQTNAIKSNSSDRLTESGLVNWISSSYDDDDTFGGAADSSDDDEEALEEEVPQEEWRRRRRVHLGEDDEDGMNDSIPIKKILITSNFFQTIHILPDFAATILHLVHFLGPSRLKFSILEGPSTDTTPQFLKEIFLPMLMELGVEEEDIVLRLDFGLEESEKWDWNQKHRIEGLAMLRNEALKPLWENPQPEAGYLGVVFMNDVYSSAAHVLELVHLHLIEESGVTCAWDHWYEPPTWEHWKGQETFYDAWVARTLSSGDTFYPQGAQFTRSNLLWSSPKERGRFDLGLPFQVISCWNGIAVLDPMPFLEERNGVGPVRFRRGGDGECSQSECFFVARDFWNWGIPRIMVVPGVRVSYVRPMAKILAKLKSEIGSYLGGQAEGHLKHTLTEVAESGKNGDGRRVRWSTSPPKKVKCFPWPDEPGLVHDPWLQDESLEMRFYNSFAEVLKYLMGVGIILAAIRYYFTNRSVNNLAAYLKELGFEGEVAARKLVVGFFHPYCNAGGGGERVLWAAISYMQRVKTGFVYFIWSGDYPAASKEDILKRAKERFDITIDPSTVVFLPLKSRYLISDSFWKRFTLLGQGFGQMICACEAIAGSKGILPDVFIDTMGYAFTFPVVSLLGRGKISIGTYIHYPTITTEMLRRVQNREAGVTNNTSVASSSWKSSVKIIYYRIFASFYTFCLRYAGVKMANGTWTQQHLDNLLLGVSNDKKNEDAPPVVSSASIVFPPCEMKGLSALPLENRESIIVSLSQFRPEKDHPLQLHAFSEFIIKRPELRSKVKLVMIGSSRDRSDEDRIEGLKKLVKELKLEDNVQFVVNAPYPILLEWLGRAEVGLHTMVDEHFGINVVEFMAAGLIPLAHASAGPLLDIIVPYKDQPTGFHAKTSSEFAAQLSTILSLPESERLAMKKRARALVNEKFSTEIFERDWEEAWVELVGVDEDADLGRVKDRKDMEREKMEAEKEIEREKTLKKIQNLKEML